MTDIDRADARGAFLDAHGWGDASIKALTGDASSRRYFRMIGGRGPAMLMDAPPDTENAGAFIDIADYLRTLGLSTPRIFAADRVQGFAIIEDFGRDTFTHLLDSGADEQPLYELAVDVLVHLRLSASGARVNCRPYDRDTLIREAVLLADWYLPAISRSPTPDAVREAYCVAWQEALGMLPAYEPTPVLRDYHVDNLMVLAGRAGVARCGLLDFQDALMGHPAYDLMSLLEDARRDVPHEIVSAMRARYAERWAIHEEKDFSDWYHLLGALRHAKVAGIFVRLSVRDGKPGYLKHLPRVVRLLDSNLAAPALAPVKQWFDKHLPDLADSPAI